MLRPLADWLSGTALSTLFQNTLWIVPTSQSIHIVCLSVVVCSALMIHLKLLGFVKRGRSAAQTTQHLLPWMWRALAGLLATGLVQTVAEPVRQFVAPAFWIKMALVLVVTLMTIRLPKVVRGVAAHPGSSETPAAGTRRYAAISLLLWVSIVICGRLIGYTWSSYA